MAAKLKTLPGGGSVSIGAGTKLFGSNPIIDNPLNPVYDVEQAGHAINYTGQQASDIANTVGGVLSGASSAASAVGSLTTFLTNGQNWIRLLEVLAGVILVVMGLHQLTGAGGTVVNVAKKAATAGRA